MATDTSFRFNRREPTENPFARYFLGLLADVGKDAAVNIKDVAVYEV